MLGRYSFYKVGYFIYIHVDMQAGGGGPNVHFPIANFICKLKFFINVVARCLFCLFCALV